MLHDLALKRWAVSASHNSFSSPSVYIKVKMKLAISQIRDLIIGMRQAYENGENAMGFARRFIANPSQGNLPFASLVAYDLQSGTYVEGAKSKAEFNKAWCEQVGLLVKEWLPQNGRLLEVGVGEATTLKGVIDVLGEQLGASMGFDISWSRIDTARIWLAEAGLTSELFVADLFNIPLADDSVDVVYTSHSLEPNGGREKEAIRECLRVARVALVLVEPIYELASEAAKNRMQSHGYVRDLKRSAEELSADICEYRLLELTSNPLNPSGVLVLRKRRGVDLTLQQHKEELKSCRGLAPKWCCPVTRVEMSRQSDCFYAPSVGLAYPILRDIPLLAAEHLIVASKLDSSQFKKVL